MWEGECQVISVFREKYVNISKWRGRLNAVAVDMSACFVDYVVNFGMIDTAPGSLVEYLLKNDNLAAPIHRTTIIRTS